MQKEERKFCDSTVFEGMTSIRAIIKSIDAGTNDRKIEKILFDKEKIHKISKEVGYFKAVSSKYGFELQESTSEELEKITLGTSHGGIVAITSGRNIPHLTECKAIVENGFYAMIEGIEDPYNFGYALRSLYATGADGIILPPRNWMSAAGVVCRSSAGASELFEIFESDPVEAVKLFKAKGYKIVCAEEKTDSVLGKCALPLPILLIVGGEKRGISRAVLDLADVLVKIDYGREFKASLSAASATTMFAYEIMRQNSGD
ncbi:MAG: RNA methyltransferase [Ruminococcaceae bacterium]|nr:RNA methyltransferase [Oscillospiraceae bacterium]